MIPEMWRRPGCSDACRYPNHDPQTHENYGFAKGRSGGLIVHAGPMAINLETRLVTVNGQNVPLAGRPWAILAALASLPGIVVTREALYVMIYRRPVDPNYHVKTKKADRTFRELGDHNVLRTLIYRLRKSLGPEAGARIICLSGRGYRLDVDPNGSGVILAHTPREGENTYEHPVEREDLPLGQR